MSSANGLRQTTRNWQGDPWPNPNHRAKKYTPKQKLSREQSNNLIYSTIFAPAQPISQEQVMALIVPFRAQMDALRRSKLDPERLDYA